METQNDNLQEENQTQEEKQSWLRRFFYPQEAENSPLYNRVISYFPFIAFLSLLASVHIANNHNAENKVRQTEQLEKKMKELRWEYMTTKSELMLKSKQSEMSKLLENTGLEELRNPPIKLRVGKYEYE